MTFMNGKIEEYYEEHWKFADVTSSPVYSRIPSYSPNMMMHNYCNYRRPHKTKFEEFYDARFKHG